MSEPISISTGIASRYATAVFDLMKDDGAIGALESDVTALHDALDASPEFRDMIASPVVTREDQAAVVAQIADKAGLSQIIKNTLALMASKRRLFVLPQLVQQLQRLIDVEKGVVEAEVTSAHPLSQAQQDELAKTLKDSVGSDIKLNAVVDESLIGGLIVKVGSRMIDTSIRTKLAALQNSMKEVG
ncbi:MAG: F0F1 ATP synthase subunit delta [Pseudomonadota bacterium]